MSDKLRVVLLRGDDPHNLYLEQQLAQQHELVAVIVEPGKAQIDRIRRERRWRDYRAALYHRIRRNVLGLNAFRRSFFADLLASETAKNLVPPQEVVEDINSIAVINVIDTAKPDVCIVSCISIIKERILEKIDVPIINIHGGHLPDYRGCHCIFFAVIERQYGKIGSTIHFVDKGIDTGPTIEIARPSIEHSDTPESLYCKAEKLAADILSRDLGKFLSNGFVAATPAERRGRLILRRHRKFYHEVVYLLRRLSGGIDLPEVSEMQRWQES